MKCSKFKTLWSNTVAAPQTPSVILAVVKQLSTMYKYTSEWIWLQHAVRLKHVVK